VGGVAVVTGASRGIGREVATALAGAGYAVAAVGRDTGALATLERDVTAAGGRILVQRAEVTDPAEVDDCVGAVLEAFGRLDVLVNSAGVIEPEVPLWEAEVDQWWRTVTVNVRGPFLMSRASIPHMIDGGGGRVVNLASGAGLRERGDLTAYSASKSALSRLTGGIHEAGRMHGIRAFDLSPGVVRTDMTDSMRMHVGRTEWTSPQAVTDLLLALCSGDLDAWSGRYVRAGVDTPASLREQAARGVGPDDRALRLQPWGPDDPLA
jgi:NAD(P)-dependent dehydrogenase (short-subunit alcohol dehydrogenase family)